MATATTARIDATTRLAVMWTTPEALIPRRSTSSEPDVCPATVPTENTATPTSGTTTLWVIRKTAPPTPPSSAHLGREESRTAGQDASRRSLRDGACARPTITSMTRPVVMVHHAGSRPVPTWTDELTVHARLHGDERAEQDGQDRREEPMAHHASHVGHPSSRPPFILGHPSSSAKRADDDRHVGQQHPGHQAHGHGVGCRPAPRCPAAGQRSSARRS